MEQLQEVTTSCNFLENVIFNTIISKINFKLKITIMTSYRLFSKDYSWNMKVRWSKMIIKRGFLSEMDSHNLIPTIPQGVVKFVFC